jgi:ATP phosphoribosyltransferase regulatory subunit
VDADGIVQVMNFDCTLTLSQIFSKNPMYMPAKRKVAYLSKTVFTNAKRKIEESTVWGVENYNVNTPETDSELVLMAIQSLKNLGIKGFKIDLGSVEFIQAMLKDLPKTSTDKIISLIEEKNTFELSSTLNNLGLPEDQKKKICKIPQIFGPFRQSIAKAKEIALNEDALTAISRLEKIYEYVDAEALGEYMMIDMGFTNTYRYYSGIIFKGYVSEHSKIILQGGRYDKLMSNFNSQLSACGFAIDFNNLKEANAYDNYSYQQRKSS